MDDNEEFLEDRFTSHEIFERVITHADEEISRSTRELFFSSLAASFAITLTFVLYITMYDAAGSSSVMRALLYPLGFVFIVLGNYQLFTENTLPPVALVLERLASVPALLAMWTLVLVGNLLGVTVGAAVLAFSGFFSPSAVQAATSIGLAGVQEPLLTTFLRGMFAGLIVAGVVWLDFSFTDSTSRLILIYLAFLAIPLGGLFHVVISTAEVMFLVFLGELAFVTGLVQFILPVLAGNIVGGVLLVTVVNYFQTTSYVQQDSTRRLSTRDWLLSYDTGRSKEEIFGEDTRK